MRPSRGYFTLIYGIVIMTLIVAVSARAVGQNLIANGTYTIANKYSDR